MSLKLRWVNDDERDRVAETRMLCYASARKELTAYVERLRNDKRTKAGDWLLAEKDGVPVGTATSIALTMWVRGGPAPCQGVSHVGTIKTHRRKGSNNGPGVATVVMNETIRAARERGFVVSALMPFRGSFYERFGYGFVERRAEWTVPMPVLPRGDFDDVRFYDAKRDFEALIAFKQRITEAGHGDIERPAFLWENYLKQAEEGFTVVDRAGDGPIRAMLHFVVKHENMLDTARVEEVLYEDIPALRRMLYFLRSMRDQYSSTALTIPADLRLNLLLAETQMTHRAHRNHPTAEARPFNRMQVRVLDNAKLLAAMRVLPADVKGKATVAVREPEGNTTALAIDLADGRASASPTSAPPTIECDAHVWAPIVLGDLRATEAARLGLLTVRDERALSVLDAFSAGPAPFCNEYF